MTTAAPPPAFRISLREFFLIVTTVVFGSTALNMLTSGGASR